ncbi:hypothetical protein C0Q70_11486 [Pomacea canaliculata]|uniref:Uncharacterized protein n=1 Tax=Pomacea canaliculata TaxID=400727 RepID=A0A2T7P656_POMCA|nr:hypothetical protein C0Q70_11486 [Pomacea canaliculata]
MAGLSQLILQALRAKKGSLPVHLFCSIDQLPDKELESRFNSLSLAFKTDRLTLDKRLGIQERSRDLTEENIDKELRGLREAVETLNQLCNDEQVKTVIFKIQHHLNILEASVARLSGRAEVFGAVQQEKRMSRAMEVMIIHTENIRRLRGKEQSEVEEARRILSEKSQTTTAIGLDIGGLSDRRSASVSAALNNPRLTQRARSHSPSPSPNSLTQSSEKLDANTSSDARRRSEVVLPRCFGGIGSPPLTASSSMDSAGVFGDFLHHSTFSTSRQAGFENGEEPRQRFQSATANVTVRNVVSNSFRRASLERQKRLSQNSSTSSQLSRGNSSDQSVDKDQPNKISKQHSQEEEAYRQGYEEGLKASLGREIGELRNQQTTISSSLEQIMDRVDNMQQEDHQDELREETMAKVKDALGRLRVWMSNPNWSSTSLTLRHLVSGLVFFLAMLVVIFTFAPLIPSNITVRSHGQPAQ